MLLLYNFLFHASGQICVLGYSFRVYVNLLARLYLTMNKSALLCSTVSLFGCIVCLLLLRRHVRSKVHECLDVR